MASYTNKDLERSQKIKVKRDGSVKTKNIVRQGLKRATEVTVEKDNEVKKHKIRGNKKLRSAFEKSEPEKKVTTSEPKTEVKPVVKEEKKEVPKTESKTTAKPKSNSKSTKPKPPTPKSEEKKTEDKPIVSQPPVKKTDKPKAKKEESKKKDEGSKAGKVAKAALKYATGVDLDKSIKDQDWKDIAINTGLTAATLIPGVGAAAGVARAAKLANTGKKVAKAAKLTKKVNNVTNKTKKAQNVVKKTSGQKALPPASKDAAILNKPAVIAKANKTKKTASEISKANSKVREAGKKIQEGTKKVTENKRQYRIKDAKEKLSETKKDWRGKALDTVKKSDREKGELKKALSRKDIKSARGNVWKQRNPISQASKDAKGTIKSSKASIKENQKVLKQNYKTVKDEAKKHNVKLTASERRQARRENRKTNSFWKNLKADKGTIRNARKTLVRTFVKNVYNNATSTEKKRSGGCVKSKSNCKSKRK